MRSRFVRAAVFALAAGAFLAPARADWIADFCRSVVQDVKRRECWPKPFVCQDRQFTRAPCVIMVANGWEQQNLLGDHHFNPGDGQLTEAGRLKVRWILTEAPGQHRTVFVHRADNPDETAARMDAVQQVAARMVPQGQLPAVVLTDTSAQGWPAERVDNIGRKFQASAPNPRLPQATGDSSGGSK